MKSIKFFDVVLNEINIHSFVIYLSKYNIQMDRHNVDEFV